MVISQIALWVLMGGLYAAVFLLYRYLGHQLRRRDQIEAMGPAVGSAPEQLRMSAHDEAEFVLGGRCERPRVVVFVRDNCPACANIRLQLRSAARRYAPVAETVIAYRGGSDQMNAYAAGFDGEAVFLADGEASSRWRIPGTPFVVALDAVGVVRRKGFVQSSEHLESYFQVLSGSAEPGNGAFPEEGDRQGTRSNIAPTAESTVGGRPH